MISNLLINFQNFVIILLSQTVVRTLSRQPFFFIIRYSFPTYLTFLSNRKTPETQGFWGILRLDTTLSCDNKSIFRLYYSMIVATRPDPTVRPPSRYQTGVLRCANGDFSCDLCGKIRISHCVLMVFGDFVIMVLSFRCFYNKFICQFIIYSIF